MAESRALPAGVHVFRYEAGELCYEPPESAPDDWEGNLNDLIGDYVGLADLPAIERAVREETEAELRDGQRLVDAAEGRERVVRESERSRAIGELLVLAREFDARGEEGNLTDAQRACWQHAALRLRLSLKSAEQPPVVITIRDEGAELSVNCELSPAADEFDSDDQLPETHMLAALMMSMVDGDDEDGASPATLRHERDFWSWKHDRRLAEIQELREELSPDSPNYLAPEGTA